MLWFLEPSPESTQGVRERMELSRLYYKRPLLNASLLETPEFLNSRPWFHRIFNIQTTRLPTSNRIFAKQDVSNFSINFAPTFIVPCVPTGINTGVLTSLCGRERRPWRALPVVRRTLKLMPCSEFDTIRSCNL